MNGEKVFGMATKRKQQTNNGQVEQEEQMLELNEADENLTEDGVDMLLDSSESENEEGAEAAEPMTPEAALEFLLQLGKSQGFVSYDDVLRVMPEAENNMDQLEDAFAALFEQGIEVGQARDTEGEKSEEEDAESSDDDAFDQNMGGT